MDMRVASIGEWEAMDVRVDVRIEELDARLAKHDALIKELDARIEEFDARLAKHDALIKELDEKKTLFSALKFKSAIRRFEQWRKKLREENGRKRKRANKILASQEDQDQQFLPGIPDEITLKVIVPKLRWRALQALMCVSRVWKQAYESRQVYAARVHAHATERFDVTQQHFPSFGNRLVVRYYDIWRDVGLSYVLPSIPRAYSRRGTQHIIRSLDGKIYAAGGKKILKFFVLDLAGQKQWTECASMQEPREHETVSGSNLGKFRCLVRDGKLYVSGGVSSLEKATSARDGRCEVYDPCVDSWSFTEFEQKTFMSWWNEKRDESFLEV